jgi:CDP-diacylglycerol--serine O-phosphatidyltransferase
VWRIAADTATLGVMACGAAALVLRERTTLALILISAAAMLDGVDGALARRAGGPAAHGALLDVGADFTAFGLAPAAVILATRAAPSPTLWAGIVAFLGAALFRLVRCYRTFHLAHRGYVGLPMPASGALLCGLALTLPQEAGFAAALLVAALAASRRPYPTPDALWRAYPRAALAILAAALVTAVYAYPAGMLILTGYCAAYPWMRRAAA